MKERPILMSAPMVRAILGETKSQTRRAVKGPASKADAILESESYPGEWVPWLNGEPQPSIHCPYGAPGDRLWVRETVRAIELKDGTDVVHYEADGADVVIENSREGADRWFDLHHYNSKRGAKVPGIHMPRWACRLVLEITEVRVERLNDISEVDALAEGVVWSDQWKSFVVPGVDHPNRDFPVLSRASPREMYAALWDVINGSGAWLANPWVWVVAFKRVQP